MLINQEKLDLNLNISREKYRRSIPFPSIYIDQFLTSDAIQRVQNEFPEVSDKLWTHYIHYNERKHGLTKFDHFPHSVQELVTEMSQPNFINWLEQLTGIPNIFADPNLEGSGLHQTLKGGFLNIHADFTVHPLQSNWQRRVNVLVYLNENWDAAWGGDLELWDENMKECQLKIAPLLNRVAIFSTGQKTYHGYPDPISCPENESRKSIAMYFYTKDDSFKKVSTDYKSRPEDGSKKWLIILDNHLISVYSKIKGTFGLNDDFMSSILQKFNKK